MSDAWLGPGVERPDELNITTVFNPVVPIFLACSALTVVTAIGFTIAPEFLKMYRYVEVEIPLFSSLIVSMYWCALGYILSIALLWLSFHLKRVLLFPYLLFAFVYVGITTWALFLPLTHVI